jgi:hypothetical protein
MRSFIQRTSWALGTMTLAGIFTVGAFAAKAETFTGEVSDSMCGAKHAIADKAACTRACVQKGSNYALVVGDKVYTLKTSEANKAKLDQLAGEQAKVTGTATGDTIEVSKVMAAK